jgi:hypothetical protein
LSFFNHYKIINFKGIIVMFGTWTLVIFISYLYSRVTEVHYKKIKNKLVAKLEMKLLW